jgi:NADH dehydrogenase (ubiquinone) 1 beta subcomplex subunit 8
MKVRLGLLRQSLLLPRLRPYSRLAQKELDPQLNGYPRLPNVSRQSLPPHGWWDPQMRRNRGDTV